MWFALLWFSLKIAKSGSGPIFFNSRQKRGAVVVYESAVVRPVTGYFQWFVIMELNSCQQLYLTVLLKSSLSF